MRRSWILIVLIALTVFCGQVWAANQKSKVTVDVDIEPYCKVLTPDLHIDLGSIDFSSDNPEDYGSSEKVFFQWETNTDITISSIKSEGFKLLNKKGNVTSIGSTTLNSWVTYEFRIPRKQVDGNTKYRKQTLKAGGELLSLDHTVRYRHNPEAGIVSMRIRAILDADKEEAHLVQAGTWRDVITITFSAPDA